MFKTPKRLKTFKIISERGVQSGVRRIMAYTGSLAKTWESFLARQNLELRKYLKLPLPEKSGDSFFIKKEKSFWKGSMEKQNPFLMWSDNKEKELKAFRKAIVHLQEKDSGETVFSSSLEFMKITSRFHPLALQILELREHLKLPTPDPEVIDSFLKPAHLKAEDFFEESQCPMKELKAKEQEVQRLRDQLEKIISLGRTQEKLLKTTKDFKIQGG